MDTKNDKKFSQEAFDQFILENEIVGFFSEPITLKSGRESHWYVNWRKATSDVYLLDQLTDYVLSFLRTHQLSADCIYGVPEGATKTALMAQYKWAKQDPTYGVGSHRFAMGRGKPKVHGDPKDRYFVGVPGGQTLVLEDVTTTGGSLFATVDQLLEVGVSVSTMLSLTSRMERQEDGTSVEDTVVQKFKGRIQYYSMSSALDLLPLAAKKMSPPDPVLKAVEQEFKQYGVEPLSLLIH